LAWPRDSKLVERAMFGGSHGQWRLWVVLPNGSSVPVTSKEDEVGVLVTWGNWGFAIQTSGGDAWLMTRDGETRTVRPGIIYDSHGSGWIAIVDERIELVSSGGGSGGVDASLDALGSVYDMAFSPDGDSLAITAADGMGVVRLASDGRFIRFQPGVDGFIEWSTDQRFVLFAAPRGFSSRTWRRGPAITSWSLTR